MPVINALHEKQPYSVQFNADASGNAGDLYIVMTGWVPSGNGATLPAPTDDDVQPGQFCQEVGTAPALADAWRLRIDVQVPHPSGSGTLIVTQGTAHQTIAVTDDSFFLAPLVP